MKEAQIKPKILVVEDVEIASRMAVVMLESYGCAVDTVETGSSALEIIEEKDYDLILMDLGLPDMDGLSVTETIRRMHHNPDIPIVALTAHMVIKK